MSCDIKIDGIDSNNLKTPAQIVGRLVAAQNHPDPLVGQAEINDLCRTCGDAGEEGMSAFAIAKGMTRVEVNCQMCIASRKK